MTASLATFQDDFSHALFATPDVASDAYIIAQQPGFAVYRNTVMTGCIDALQANYPSVARLVGEQWFRGAASLYVEKQPPRDARMLYYGGGFPDFLKCFEPAADLSYLSDVARLDRFWSEAHVAADAPVLEPAALSGRTAQELGETVLYPHVTARWTWFEGQPIHTIWKKNREPSEDGGKMDWKGEGVLMLRPHGNVLSFELDAAGCAFLDACRAGQSLGVAAAAAVSAKEDADLAQLLATLLNAGAFSGMSRTTHTTIHKD